jgi:dethiobiotin synthetase
VSAGLFFTGTDTGVGKTYVTARVARLLRDSGRDVRVSKPVATGAKTLGTGHCVAEDTIVLAEAAGCRAWDEVTPWHSRTGGRSGGREANAG